MTTERKYWVASQEIAAGRWVASSLHEEGCVDEILIGYWNSENKAQVDAAFKFMPVYAAKPVAWFSAAEDCWVGLAELGTPFLEMLASLDERRLGHLPTVADVISALEAQGFVSERKADARAHSH